MSIKINSNFKIGAGLPLDSRTLLTKEEMLNIDDNTQPEIYFALCKDDGLFYIYNKDNQLDSETGKFSKFTSGVKSYDDLTDKPLALNGTIANLSFSETVSAGSTVEVVDGVSSGITNIFENKTIVRLTANDTVYFATADDYEDSSSESSGETEIHDCIFKSDDTEIATLRWNESADKVYFINQTEEDFETCEIHYIIGEGTVNVNKFYEKYFDGFGKASIDLTNAEYQLLVKTGEVEQDVCYFVTDADGSLVDSNTVDLTKEEYEALSDDEKNNGKVYFVTDETIEDAIDDTAILGRTDKTWSSSKIFGELYDSIEEVNITWASSTGFDSNLNDSENVSIDSTYEKFLVGKDEVVIIDYGEDWETNYVTNIVAPLIFSKSEVAFVGGTSVGVYPSSRYSVVDTYGLCRFAVMNSSSSLRATAEAETKIYIAHKVNYTAKSMGRYFHRHTDDANGAVFYGDSVCYGYIPSTSSVATWTMPIVFQQLTAIVSTNSAVSGAAYSDINTTRLIDQVGDSITQKLIFCCGGINDWAHTVSIATFKEAVIETITKIMKNCTYDAKIFLVSPLNYATTDATWQLTNEIDLKLYRRALEEIADNYGIYYVNTENFGFSSVNDPASLYDDGLHLSVRGYIRYGFEMTDYIMDYYAMSKDYTTGVTFAGEYWITGAPIFKQTFSWTASGTITGALSLAPTSIVKIEGIATDGTNSIPLQWDASGSSNNFTAYVNSSNQVVVHSPYTYSKVTVYFTYLI